MCKTGSDIPRRIGAFRLLQAIFIGVYVNHILTAPRGAHAEGRMLHRNGLRELADLLTGRQASAREIAQDLLSRVGALNGRLNAFITVDQERCLREADEADARRARGEARSDFDGIPVAVKDNICTAGLRTTCASGILRDFVPPYDAHAYAGMRAHGFATLGKTNMDEFAMGSTTETSFFGPARNPHDDTRVPGGSSGGSAVAVAALMAPAALGSDTGGSIRQPAAFCGCVGVKPTYGRVSRYGLVAFASSLDQIGAFARSVDDAAALLAAVSGHDRRDSTSIDRPVDFGPDSLTGDVRGLRIGMPEEYFAGVAPEIADRVRAQIAALEAEGATVRPISLRLTEYAVPVYYLIATAEASSNLARYDGIRYGTPAPDAANLAELYERTRSAGFGKEVKRRIMLGTFSLSSGYYDAYYLKALKGRTLIIEDFRRAFAEVDVIVTPVTTTTAFGIGEKISDPLSLYLSDILTISANLAAIPGVSVPVGLDARGLPIGLQIMASHFQERVLLNAAKAVERVSPPVAPAL